MGKGLRQFMRAMMYLVGGLLTVTIIGGVVGIPIIGLTMISEQLEELIDKRWKKKTYVHIVRWIKGYVILLDIVTIYIIQTIVKYVKN